MSERGERALELIQELSTLLNRAYISEYEQRSLKYLEAWVNLQTVKACVQEAEKAPSRVQRSTKKETA